MKLSGRRSDLREYTIKLTKVRRVERNAYDCGIFARTMIHLVHDFPLRRQGLGGNRWFTLYGVSDGTCVGFSFVTRDRHTTPLFFSARTTNRAGFTLFKQLLIDITYNEGI